MDRVIPIYTPLSMSMNVNCHKDEHYLLASIQGNKDSFLYTLSDLSVGKRK